MISDKKNISLLADIFVKSGLENIVISPGSRNAPIIVSFANNPKINAFSIIDERSAAFFAMGISLQTRKTTAIACTSGSAALNYASAIAEAYYQKIPLLIITADRPKYLIDVGDGQTIKQKNVFKNYIKKSYELPENIDSPKRFEKAEKIINKALEHCLYPEPGPVHINIPFDEPIYGTSNEETSGRYFGCPIIKPKKDDEGIIKIIADEINKSSKVMIIAGQNQPNEKLNSTLTSLSKLNNLIILSETTSNIHDSLFIDTIDNIISTFTDDEALDFKPEILISYGGQVVSKMIKKYLRKMKPKLHWHISRSGQNMDTYQCSTKPIGTEPETFFKILLQNLIPSKSSYSKIWINKKTVTTNLRIEYLDKIEYCDLKLVGFIMRKVKGGTTIHLGNSTPVRYSQLFGSRNDITYQSNRGVSGIDGQVSTALGYSYFSNKSNIIITGDLGFLYDSNSLMNYYLVPNLKIIVINNKGGGIFRFIPGPDTTPNLEQFFETKHSWNAKYICKAFDVDYTQISSDDDFQSKILAFLNGKTDKTSLLEIHTPNEKNAMILRKYFKYLKNGANDSP